MQIYERENNFLVVLGHIPQWIIVDSFGLEILKHIVNGLTLNETAEKFSSDQYEETAEVYNDLFPLVTRKINRDSPIIEKSLTSKNTVAMIAVTKRCNLQAFCPHCYVDASCSHTNELSVDEHVHLANSIRHCLTPDPSKIYKVNLTGGEPFLHPKIIRIIETYREAGLAVNMNTNALLIKDADIPELKKFGVVLSVSLDGAEKITHERIRGPRSWEKVTRKIRQITDSGIKVGINCLLHEGNVAELEKMVEQAHLLGCSGFNPINLVQLGRACNSPLKRVSETQVFRRLAQHLGNHPEQSHLFDFSSLFSSLGAALLTGVTCENCGVGSRPCVYVGETGNVYPCPNTQREEFLLGNIRNDSLSSCVRLDHPVLTRLRSLSVAHLNKKCEVCDVRFFCGGDCRGETYNVTGDLNAPYVACEDRHDSIVELMWIVAENPSLFANKADEYISNLH